MAYSINGSTFVIPPTSGQWLPPTTVDVDGNGMPVYSAVTAFELTWSNLEPSGTYQLYQFFQSLHITGSAVVSLPRFGYNDYTFYAYTGCVVNMPQMGTYFYENTLDVRLLITKVRYDTV